MGPSVGLLRPAYAAASGSFFARRRKSFLERRDDDCFPRALDDRDQLLALRIRDLEPVQVLMGIIHERVPILLP